MRVCDSPFFFVCWFIFFAAHLPQPRKRRFTAPAERNKPRGEAAIKRKKKQTVPSARRKKVCQAPQIRSLRDDIRFVIVVITAFISVTAKPIGIAVVAATAVAATAVITTAVITTAVITTAVIIIAGIPVNVVVAAGSIIVGAGSIVIGQ